MELLPKNNSFSREHKANRDYFTPKPKISRSKEREGEKGTTRKVISGPAFFDEQMWIVWIVKGFVN